MNQKSYKYRIDGWLRKVDDEALRKVWHVVHMLDQERQLRDHNDFNLPIQKLLGSPSVSKEDVAAILASLHRKEIVDVVKFIGDFPPFLATIDLSKEIIDSSDTEVTIFSEEFNYLLKTLTAMLYKDKNSSKDFKKIKWLDSFKWLNEIEFTFGGDKIVKFGSNDSIRIQLFRMQTEAKGEYLTVEAMAKETGKSEKNVRITLGHITRENLAGTGYAILPRNDKSKKGAYRIQEISSL